MSSTIFNKLGLNRQPFALVYPPNTSGCKNVVLIDNAVKDAKLFASSVNADTFPIIYSSTSTKTELLALLKATITTIDRIGFAFASNKGIIKTFLDGKPFFVNEEAAASPYSENVEFIISLIKEFNVKNIDYLACNTLNYSNWVKYYTLLTNATGVIIGASNDKTGNIKYGGDWIMESTSQDIELVYFTNSIEYYSYLLDNPPNYQTLKLVWNDDPNVYAIMVLDIAYAISFQSQNQLPPFLISFILSVNGVLYSNGTDINGMFYQYSNPLNYSTSNMISQFDDINIFSDDPNGPHGFNEFTFIFENDHQQLYTLTSVNLLPPTNSNICFPAGTPIQTDQGIIAIEKINPDIHTIHKKPIIDVTKTITSDKYLVGFKKNALGLNCPTEKTQMSQEHKVYYQGKMLAAKTFLGKFEKVVKVKYTGEILYNILMADHSHMIVNNLMCETLHPDNIIAKLYTKNCKYTDETRDKIVVLLKECQEKNDYKTYNKIVQRC
jgi:hypothetical protein